MITHWDSKISLGFVLLIILRTLSNRENAVIPVAPVLESLNMDAADGGTLSVTAKKRLQLPFDLAFAQTIHKSQVIFTFHSE